MTMSAKDRGAAFAPGACGTSPRRESAVSAPKTSRGCRPAAERPRRCRARGGRAAALRAGRLILDAARARLGGRRTLRDARNRRRFEFLDERGETRGNGLRARVVLGLQALPDGQEPSLAVLRQ